jgi:hypothetical protein
VVSRPGDVAGASTVSTLRAPLLRRQPKSRSKGVQDEGKERAKTEGIEMPGKHLGELKAVGGSMSDQWNSNLANETIRTLWFFENSEPEVVKKQQTAAIDALVGIAPRDECEGMIAAQLVACHHASMECYRRAMLPEQTFEGRHENLNQANKLSRTHTTLLEALNRHRGKGQQKVTVEHVHVHAGGQAGRRNGRDPGGRGFSAIKGSTPCRACLCTGRHDAEHGHGAGARASRRQCRMVAAGCTAERHRALRREIKTPSSTGATPRTPLLAVDLSLS